MRIDNSFEVPLPVDQAWQLLLDVPTVAGCIPGVRLTEVIDGHTFRGTASVKVGPIQLQLASQARLENVDDTARSAVIRGEGVDAKGRGQAKSAVSFRLVPMEGSTRVQLSTELALSGSIAQYGRASGLIQEIANQLLGQFATNLRQLIRDQATSRPTDSAGPKPAAPVQPAVSAVGLLYGALKNILQRWLSRTRAQTPADADDARR